MVVLCIMVQWFSEGRTDMDRQKWQSRSAGTYFEARVRPSHMQIVCVCERERGRSGGTLGVWGRKGAAPRETGWISVQRGKNSRIRRAAAALLRLLLLGRDYRLELLLSPFLAVATVGRRCGAGYLLGLVDCCLFDVGSIHCESLLGDGTNRVPTNVGGNKGSGLRRRHRYETGVQQPSVWLLTSGLRCDGTSTRGRGGSVAPVRFQIVGRKVDLVSGNRLG